MLRFLQIAFDALLYKRSSQTTVDCRNTQCEVYRDFKRATFCARLLVQLSENGASYAADYAHQMLSNPKDAPLRSFSLDYPSFFHVRQHPRSLVLTGPIMFLLFASENHAERRPLDCSFAIIWTH